MEDDRRHQPIENAGFDLALGASAAVPFLLLVAAAIAVSRQPAPVAVMVVFSVVMLAIPVLSLAGVVVGHVARHGNWRSSRGRYALVLGYWTLVSIVILTVFSVLTFVLIL